MKIGISLPVTYLAGEILNKEDELWQEIYGPAPVALAHLQSAGVCSIEINKVRKTTKNTLVLKALQTIFHAKLQATIHGWLPQKVISGQGHLIDETLLNLLSSHTASAIPVTVHGHHVGEQAERDAMLSMTITNLASYSERLQTEKLPLIPALEVCRIKEHGPVGDTYAEVYSLASQVGFHNVGICWDLGHTQANYLLGKDMAMPNDTFIQQVIHTHIHDVGVDGRTHFPVVSRDGYVAEGVKRLKDVGYTGVYNLELYPIRWDLSPKECLEKLDLSIAAIV